MPTLFSESSARRVSKATRWVEGQYHTNNYRQRKRRGGGGGAGGGVGKTTTIITSFDDTTNTAGYGTVQAYQLNDSGVLVTVGNPFTAYNMAYEIISGAWIQFKRDDYGKPWIDVELCPETP